MTSFVIGIGIVIIQLVLIYILSRISIDETYIVIKRLTKNHDVSLAILSFIFLPGTIIHELSHFITATILFLRVVDVQIFPKWDNYSVKLGSVVYEKKDAVRGVIVGISPLFFGSLILVLIRVLRLFPHESIFINSLMVYLIFIISSTMFSSKQDLQDFVFIIPLFFIVGIIFYVFDIRFAMIIQEGWYISLLENVTKISGWLKYPLFIHLALIILFKSLRHI